MTRITTSIVALSLLVACKKQPVIETAEPTTPAVTMTTEPTALLAQVEQLRENFSRVHFTFDSAELTDDGRAALVANAAILKRHPLLKVEVQGHADERGTTDYNIALGTRRAETIRSTLVAEGVAPSRITVISYGEERPLDTAQGEVAWSANRRAEFRILHADGMVAGTTDK